MTNRKKAACWKFSPYFQKQRRGLHITLQTALLYELKLIATIACKNVDGTASNI